MPPLGPSHLRARHRVESGVVRTDPTRSRATVNGSTTSGWPKSYVRKLGGGRKRRSRAGKGLGRAGNTGPGLVGLGEMGVPLIGRALLLIVASVGVLLRSHGVSAPGVSLLLFVGLLIVPIESQKSHGPPGSGRFRRSSLCGSTSTAAGIVGGAVLAIWALFELDRPFVDTPPHPAVVGPCALPPRC